MLCPKCGTETVRILGDDYCPKCSSKVLDLKKKSQINSVLNKNPQENLDDLKITKPTHIIDLKPLQKEEKIVTKPEKKKVNQSVQVTKDSLKALIFGLLSTIFVIFFLFLASLWFSGDLSENGKNIFLICTGLSAAFAGGLVSAKFDSTHYIKNAFILALILVLINSLFNIFYSLNIYKNFLSFLMSVFIYPLPFLSGALFYKKWLFK